MLDYSRTDFPECAALTDCKLGGGWCAKKARGVCAAQCHECQRAPTETGSWFLVEIMSDPFPRQTFRAYSAGTRAYVRSMPASDLNELFDGNYRHGAQRLTKRECRDHLRIVARADARTQSRLNEAYRQSWYQ